MGHRPQQCVHRTVNRGLKFTKARKDGLGSAGRDAARLNGIPTEPAGTRKCFVQRAISEN